MVRATSAAALFSLIFLITVTSAVAGEGAGEAPAGIRFLHDLTEGQRIANETGRPLVLYFTFDT